MRADRAGRIVAGRNDGCPVVSFGRLYPGARVSEHPSVLAALRSIVCLASGALWWVIWHSLGRPHADPYNPVAGRAAPLFNAIAGIRLGEAHVVMEIEGWSLGDAAAAR